MKGVGRLLPRRLPLERLRHIADEFRSRILFCIVLEQIDQVFSQFRLELIRRFSLVFELF